MLIAMPEFSLGVASVITPVEAVRKRDFMGSNDLIAIDGIGSEASCAKSKAHIIASVLTIGFVTPIWNP